MVPSVGVVGDVVFGCSLSLSHISLSLSLALALVLSLSLSLSLSVDLSQSLAIFECHLFLNPLSSSVSLKTSKDGSFRHKNYKNRPLGEVSGTYVYFTYYTYVYFFWDKIYETNWCFYVSV